MSANQQEPRLDEEAHERESEPDEECDEEYDEEYDNMPKLEERVLLAEERARWTEVRVEMADRLEGVLIQNAVFSTQDDEHRRQHNEQCEELRRQHDEQCDELRIHLDELRIQHDELCTQYNEVRTQRNRFCTQRNNFRTQCKQPYKM
jgi:hypothetical protein